MLLNTVSPSNVFTQLSDPSPTFRKSENVSSIPIYITTIGRKNRSKLNHIFPIKCFQKSTREGEEVTKNKKVALAEWLSSTKKAAGNPSSSLAPPFKSTGTPSAPSRRKINTKHSPFVRSTPRSHGQLPKPSKTQEPATWKPEKPNPKAAASETLEDDGREVVLGNNGLAYRLAEAPFEFQYSYTETPKVKPLALREAAFVPFGPTTMPRPWTGRAPLPPSKKKLPEFDSFKLPPPNKKGVKHIQPPGPFLEGQGPKYVKTREEILGERLTREEIKQLVDSSCHSSRQLNIGRDGLTHNMLENIHAYWKRRRVCKIKCKGVPTVDMDNICNQLEDKSGGKIIHMAGGAVYLFRGRNYNYKTRPVFPMMLWKPVAAVYPRLIERAPGGLTIEEANKFRKKGRSLLPICKLAKNGVYLNLVKDVRDAFEVSDLVRVDCRGLNPSDYKKIGAKLKDLVPCVLLSFEYEHILMWRGKDWKPNERGVGAPETYSDKECSVADSVKDTTRYTVMTTLPLDEKLGSEHLVSEYALTKESVIESNSMLFANVADEASGDNDGITKNLEKSTGPQLLVKNAEDTNGGEVGSLEDKLGTPSSSEVELEELIKSNEVEDFPDEERALDVSVSSKNIDTQCLGKDSAYHFKISSCSKVELEELAELNQAKVFTDGEVDLSVSLLATNTFEKCLGQNSAYNLLTSDVPFVNGREDAAMSASKQLSEDRDTQCLGENSAYNSQTTSSSKAELQEVVELNEEKVFTNEKVDLSVSILATNKYEKCLVEDSACVPLVYGGEDAAVSASKQLSEDSDTLSKTVDDASNSHTDLTFDSSKILTESFFSAAETSMVGEELVESTNKESNLHSDKGSKYYAQREYAEETNGQETNSTSENSQGVGFHIEALWEQAIDSGRVLLLDESASDPDIIHEKAIAFAKNAPAGPFFKRRFSHKKVIKKPWKRNSQIKSNESEGQKSAQRNFDNGRGEISLPSDDLPRGGLPLDELARLLAQ